MFPIYQVDAFTTELFRGNPAAVCPTDTWLSDDVMQHIAAENNLSETAFVVPDESGEADFGLRWFTPKAEVDLCGHATLATAWVIFNELNWDKDLVTFSGRSGVLSVARGEKDLLSMDFPVCTLKPAPHPAELDRALGGRALDYCVASNDMRLAVLGSVEAVQNLKPHLGMVAQMGDHGLVVTAKGAGDVDFVSRFFAPQLGITEDPVTGAAHTVLVPYWARRLKKDTFKARQISKRGGEVLCQLEGDRVKLSGRAVLYMKGEVYI